MHRVWGALGAIVGMSMAAGAAEDRIVWEKADGILAKASTTGKPVIWYFVMNQFVKDGAAALLDLNAAAAEKAFTNHVIVRKREPFHWVRGDQMLANSFKVQGAPAIIVTDPDGDVILRAPIRSAENLNDAMEAVLKEKYVNAPVAWGDIVHTGPIKKKLLVIGFDDEKGEALKAMEDRCLVKHHKTCEFVKLSSEKGGEALRHWSVDRTPTVVICDAMEHVLERVSGKLTPAQLKAAIARAIQKLDHPHGQGR